MSLVPSLHALCPTEANVVALPDSWAARGGMEGKQVPVDAEGPGNDPCQPLSMLSSPSQSTVRPLSGILSPV